jgi:hypothetical protein
VEPGEIEALRAFGWEAAADAISAAASAGSRSCRQPTTGALHAQE